MEIQIRSRISPRSWIEIDLNAIRENALTLKSFLKSDVKIIAVVKSNAYEHGIVEVADVLKDLVTVFAVSGLEEACALRDSGIDNKIIFLSNPLNLEDVDFIMHKDIIPTINSIEILNLYEKKASQEGKSLNVHFKIDTGMSRLGIQWDNKEELVKSIQGAKHLNIQGCFTHFAHAEDIQYTRNQIERFESVVKFLRQYGYSFIQHAANSSAILRMPSVWYDSVRPGLMLYGIYPDLGVKNRIKLRQAISFKTKLMQVKEIKNGDYVGYCCTYKAPADMKIGIVPVGYSHGIPWSLSSKGFLLLQGKRVPILGRVSMDQIILDLRGIENPCIGDEVVITGKQIDDEIRIEELAELSNTIPYEILCNFGKVRDKIYLKDD